MNKLFTLLFAFSCTFAIAQNETIVVSAQENAQLVWYENYDATAVFPTDETYEKITMDFVLGCADGGCSHWDYTVSIYLMEPTGLLDSSITQLDTLETDSTIVDTLWNVYETYEKFELGRLITPYGNYMDWVQPSDPNDLFDSNWEQSYLFDVTDFAPLLKDSTLIRVHYGGWSSGFSADIEFNLVKGTPARDVLSIENLYPVGGYSYEGIGDDVYFPSVSKSFNENVGSVALKSYISGHGHEGPQSCCEWVSKEHKISINGNEEFAWDVWKDCGMNPLYPQGGTWPFDRAGWCPGTAVDLEVHDLSGFISTDADVAIDYGIQAYSSNGEAAGSFIVSQTLFTYGDNNYTKDVALNDIIKPSKKDEWSRMNPICGNPVVEIKNYGSETLTSATINYGVDGEELMTYSWTGSLDFNETIWIELPTPDWNGITENSLFYAEAIIEGDGNTNNNSFVSEIEIPEVIPSTFVFEFRTQANFQGVNRAQQSSYAIYDMEGEIMYERNGGLEASTWYKDSIMLPIGCYELVFKDSAEDGVNEHWYSGESASFAGRVQMRNVGNSIFKKFPDDFGEQIDFRFTVDYPMELEEALEGSFDVFPNPTNNFITMSVSLSKTNDVDFVVYNSLGEELERVSKNNFTVGSHTFDTSKYIPGIYFCKIISQGNEQVRKFVILD